METLSQTGLTYLDFSPADLVKTSNGFTAAYQYHNGGLGAHKPLLLHYDTAGQYQSHYAPSLPHNSHFQLRSYTEVGHNGVFTYQATARPEIYSLALDSLGNIRWQKQGANAHWWLEAFPGSLLVGAVSKPGLELQRLHPQTGAALWTSTLSDSLAPSLGLDPGDGVLRSWLVQNRLLVSLGPRQGPPRVLAALDTSGGQVLQVYPLDSADAATLENPGRLIKAYQNGRRLDFTACNSAGQVLAQGQITLPVQPAGVVLSLQEILPLPNGLIAQLEARDTAQVASYPIFVGVNANLNQIRWQQNLNLQAWRHFFPQTIKIDEAGQLYGLLSPSNYGTEYGNPTFLLQLDSAGQFNNHAGVKFIATTEWERPGLGLYPQPATGELKVQLPTVAEGAVPYRLYGLTGQMYQRGHLAFSGGEATLDLHKLPQGSYFLILETGEKRYRARVTVGH